MTVLTTQFGLGEESTYGTVVATSKFFEYDEAVFEKQMGRVESMGHRKNQRVQRSDRFEPYTIGVTGRVRLDIPTKGAGILFKHWLGAAAIGSVSDSNYTQTHTLATKTGLKLTGQVNEPFNDGTAQARTFHGLKILSGELAMDRLGKLVGTFEFDGEDEDTSTALDSASYASDTRVFAWTAGSFTVASAAIEIDQFSVKVTNPLNTGRHYLRGSTLKKEPLGNGREEIEWSFRMSHTALTTYNRVISATRAGALAEIVATFDGPIAHGGSTLPRITVTIPAARFDKVSGLGISSFDEISPTFSGVGLHDGSNEPITLTYRTTDSAVV